MKPYCSPKDFHNEGVLPFGPNVHFCPFGLVDGHSAFRGVIYLLIRDRFLFFVNMELKRLGIGIRDVSNKFGLVG